MKKLIKKLEKEDKELMSKLFKLTNFIYHNDKFDSLSKRQQGLLYAQQAIMEIYSLTLEARINTINKEE